MARWFDDLFVPREWRSQLVLGLSLVAMFWGLRTGFRNQPALDFYKSPSNHEKITSFNFPLQLALDTIGQDCYHLVDTETLNFTLKALASGTEEIDSFHRGVVETLPEMDTAETCDSVAHDVKSLSNWAGDLQGNLQTLTAHNDRLQATLYAQKANVRVFMAEGLLKVSNLAWSLSVNTFFTLPFSRSNLTGLLEVDDLWKSLSARQHCVETIDRSIQLTRDLEAAIRQEDKHLAWLLEILDHVSSQPPCEIHLSAETRRTYTQLLQALARA